MPEHRPPCDVLIVGGGPAAGTAARLLAMWGRRVVVAAKPEAPGPDLPVSLTPSCGKFFDLMGIRSAIDDLGFVRSGGHTVWWGSADARVESFDAGVAGWQAGAARLGRALVGAAARAGASVVPQALTAEDVMTWPATFRLDCTGRAGVLARTLGERQLEPGHRTVALIGWWDGVSAPDVDTTHTLLESYADGWAWSIPVDATRRGLAVMVDPQATALARGDGARATYLAEVLKTRHLSAMIRSASLAEGPVGWDASMYCAGRFAGDGWLVVGDAGSFVDPLSSAGVKKAMASAWLAAVTVNSALHDSTLTGPATSLFVRREVSTYQQFLGMTRRYMAAAAGARADAHRFWADRADEPDDAGGMPRAEVEAAFERLKAADPLRLSASPDLRIEVRPLLGERLVRLEPHVVTDDEPGGVRYLLDVDVVTLLELAPAAADVPGLYAAYTSRAGEVPWPSFLTALATTMARTWLRLE